MTNLVAQQHLERKVVNEHWIAPTSLLEGLLDPREVDVHQATGGFNSLVQVSANACLRHYRAAVNKVSVVTRRSGLAPLTDLIANKQLVDPYWAHFDPASTSRVIGVVLSPAAMRFQGDDGIEIEFRGSLKVLERIPTGPGTANEEREVLPPSRTGSRPPSSVGTANEEREVLPPSMTGSPPPSSVGTANEEREVLLPSLIDGYTTSKVVGAVTMTVQARLTHRADVARTAVEVLGDFANANVTVVPEPGDTEAIYAAVIVPLENNLCAQAIPTTLQPITPLLSLVGRSSANVTVTEFAHFDARVFWVALTAGPFNLQAVCVAFDTSPGCAGIIERARHFIGGYDYGVIHDELVIERVFQHKWNQGGFDRSLRLKKDVVVKVSRDGQDRDEDATIHGRLVLDTLDTVALDPDANQRTDLLLLAGAARSVPDRVVLHVDGTELTPANADLGPDVAARWGVKVSPAISITPDPDPEMRDFQEQLHLDGTQHLARPFAAFPPEPLRPEVQYTRTEAIAKRMFFLGLLPSVFA